MQLWQRPLAERSGEGRHAHIANLVRAEVEVRQVWQRPAAAAKSGIGVVGDVGVGGAETGGALGAAG